MKKTTFMCFLLLTFFSQSYAQFTENFDASTTLPTGWSIINGGGSNEWVISDQGTDAHSGTNVASINYNSTAHDDYLISPAINVTTGVNDRFSFYTISFLSSFLESYEVLLSTTTNTAASDFSVILQSNQTASATWEKKEFSLASYVGQTVYIAIRATGTDEYILGVDDFVNDANPSCPQPTALTTNIILPTSAELSWTENGTASLYNVEVVTSGTTPTGTATDTGVNNPFNKTGLTPATSYDYYVQADCGGGDLSLWSGPFTFTTACVAIDSFNENFDGVTTPDLPACWSSLMDNGASTYAYVETSTSADNTAPNGVTLYNDDSSSTANIMLISPLLSNLSDGTNQLRFFARASTDSQDIEVGTITNTADGSTFTPLTTVDLSSTYTEYIVSFDSYFGLDSYIAIRRLSTSTYTYVYLDNIIWETIPACQDPFGLAIANLSDVSGDITWSATSGNYEYVLDTNATDPTGSGTGLATETYNATGLTPLTDYYFHVRTDCGGGTFSGWSTFMFTTLNTPPANNNCANAQVLTLGGVFADNAVIGTNVDATDSNETAPGCALYSGGDVWYQVTIPASGNLTIETNSLSGSSIADTGMAVYSGSCGSLVLIECDDDDSADGNFSLVALTGRTAGEIVYVRVWEYGNNVFDAFQVSAYDASLSSSAFDLTNFRAYPNPVKDILNLEYTSNITSISVFNLLGQEVLSNKVDATSAKIDMSQLNSGAYIVNITIDGAQQVIKVIKE